MRTVPYASLIALSVLTWLCAGCADEPRALCSDAADCGAFCVQLGLSSAGAACTAGRCSCELPDPDASELGEDGTQDTAPDAPDTADTADTADAPDTALDVLDTSSDDDADSAADTDAADSSDADTADDDEGPDGTDTTEDGVDGDVAPLRCPPDMVDRGAYCMDRYEAPNYEGALPLVMYTFDEAEAWCAERDKRLCFDDEWTSTCEGPEATAYPYGSERIPGVCNDDETWRAYNQSRLSSWPWGLPTSQIDALQSLLDAARSTGPAGSDAADHVESLYQAEPSGQNAGCTNAHGVYDLVGNVEEWTRRRDGGSPDFHGNLKGRYWADTRTCQSNLTSHADGFRFYEIGFRCCREVP